MLPPQTHVLQPSHPGPVLHPHPTSLSQLAPFLPAPADTPCGLEPCIYSSPPSGRGSRAVSLVIPLPAASPVPGGTCPHMVARVPTCRVSSEWVRGLDGQQQHEVVCWNHLRGHAAEGQGRSFLPTPDLQSWGAWGRGWGAPVNWMLTQVVPKVPPVGNRGCGWPILGFHALDLHDSYCFSDPLSAPWSLLVHTAGLITSEEEASARGTCQWFFAEVLCSETGFSVGSVDHTRAQAGQG